MGMKALVGAALLALCVGVTAAADDDPVFVSIGSDHFALSDLRDFVRKRPALQGKLVNQTGIAQVVAEFVDAVVFRREGERLQIRAPAGVMPNEDAYYYSVQFALLPKCAAPAEDGLKSRYDADPAAFGSSPLVRVSRVLWPADRRVGADDAKSFLASARARIEAGELGFEALLEDLEARAQGEQIRLPPGGDQGFQMLPPGARRTEAIDIELTAAPIESLVGPLESGGFVFLLKVLDRREPVVPPWPNARAEVERAMINECRSNAMAAKRAELHQRYEVVFDQTVISQIRPVTAPPMTR